MDRGWLRLPLCLAGYLELMFGYCVGSLMRTTEKPGAWTRIDQSGQSDPF